MQERVIRLVPLGLLLSRDLLLFDIVAILLCNLDLGLIQVLACEQGCTNTAES